MTLMKSVKLVLSLFLITAGSASAGSPVEATAPSRVMPSLLSALRAVAAPESSARILSIDASRMRDILERSGVSREYLARVLERLDAQIVEGSNPLSLPAEDPADTLTHEYVKGVESGSARISEVEGAPLAVHATRLDVVEKNNWVFKDSLYAYFFVTDGVIPTGRTTGIYKNMSSHSSVFLTEVDRVLFPMSGKLASVPHHHLIVDYGIVKSNGDDIAQMQKITSIILDLAGVIYGAVDPVSAALMEPIRREVKNLANALIALQSDDRMAVGTFQATNADFDRTFGDRTYFEQTFEHKGRVHASNWDYKITFRFLKGD